MLLLSSFAGDHKPINLVSQYILLKGIAARQEISKKYLEIIVKDMVAGGLVVGASGKGGGVPDAAAVGGV